MFSSHCSNSRHFRRNSIAVILTKLFTEALHITCAIWKINIDFLSDCSRDADEVATLVFCDNPPLSFHGTDPINLQTNSNNKNSNSLRIIIIIIIIITMILVVHL